MLKAFFWASCISKCIVVVPEPYLLASDLLRLVFKHLSFVLKIESVGLAQSNNLSLGSAWPPKFQLMRHDLSLKIIACCGRHVIWIGRVPSVGQ